jgi:HSP20 family molecular chaperone IbpA
LWVSLRTKLVALPIEIFARGMCGLDARLSRAEIVETLGADFIRSHATQDRTIRTPRPGLHITLAIEIAEKEKAFELTAELPSLDAKNIDLQLSDAC